MTSPIRGLRDRLLDLDRAIAGSVPMRPVRAAERVAERLLPRPDHYPTANRSIGLTARVGTLLGVVFAICFVTGLISHFIQNPVPGIAIWPSQPWWGYRVTQGVHVTAGVAAIPLLAVKVWSVAPKFWKRPMIGTPLQALERGSILIVVAASGFELITGVLNVAEFYAWTFFFPWAHFALAWVVIGGTLLHIAVKLPVIRRGFGEGRTTTASGDGVSRRGVMGVAVAGAGLAALSRAGDTVPVLSPLSVYAQRSGDGPQGLPVNTTARTVGVAEAAVDPQWRFEVAGRDGRVSLSLGDLAALPQRTARLPIACVEGWAVTATWTGVSVRDLLALVDEPPGAVRMISLDRNRYGTSLVSPQLAADPDCLVALELNGEPLHVDHGFPARLIAPNRPGAMQTKWLRRLEIVP